MADNSEVKKWLAKAGEDYSFSASQLPETTFFAQTCFFLQQSAEKYLKAYIIKNGLDFRKIHDLSELLKICKNHLPTFGTIRDECFLLNTYYIDTRYPVHWPTTIAKDEAIKAAAAARRIKEFVEKLLLG